MRYVNGFHKSGKVHAVAFEGERGLDERRGRALCGTRCFVGAFPFRSYYLPHTCKKCSALFTAKENAR